MPTTKRAFAIAELAEALDRAMYDPWYGSLVPYPENTQHSYAKSNQQAQVNFECYVSHTGVASNMLYTNKPTKVFKTSLNISHSLLEEMGACGDSTSIEQTVNGALQKMVKSVVRDLVEDVIILYGKNDNYQKVKAAEQRRKQKDEAVSEGNVGQADGSGVGD